MEETGPLPGDSLCQGYDPGQPDPGGEEAREGGAPAVPRGARVEGVRLSVEDLPPEIRPSRDRTDLEWVTPYHSSIPDPELVRRSLAEGRHILTRDRVSARVHETHDSFAACPECRRVYWEGSHTQRIRRRMERILET